MNTAALPLLDASRSALEEASPRPPEPLDGVLVACDQIGVMLYLDGDGFRARTADGSPLPERLRPLLRANKPAVMAHLRRSDADRHWRLIAAYDATLWALGEQWKVTRERQPLEAEGVLLLNKMLAAMDRYKALCLEGVK